MSGKELDWTLYRSIAKDAARKVARNYPGIDAEDIEQNIYQRVLEQQATFKRIGYTNAALFSIFTNYGTKYANDERISSFSFSDQYHYTAKEIRTLCGEALFDRAAFMDKVEQGDERLYSDPEEILARVIDLQTAYNEASDADRAILHRRFVEGQSPRNNAESKALSRAIDSLTVRINVGRSKRRSDHDGPGARRAMRNSAAQAALKIQEG